ncbi:MAG TPA: tetratricopeptide repeat protein, partial [Phenylobacterium sp.]|nr:tetratricopeptide repeat protein [Phenylobacterium sp.]
MSEPTTTVQRLSYAQALERAYRAGSAGDLEQAEKLYRILVRHAPGGAASANLGHILAERGDAAEAEAVYLEGLKATPHDQNLRWQYGFLLLREGRWKEGWPFYEARRAKGGWQPQLSFPEWDGGPVNSLLVLPDEGRGDQIQFVRFPAMLARQGVEVTLICAPSLARLFQPLGMRVLPAQGEIDIPRHDAWVLAASIAG